MNHVMTHQEIGLLASAGSRPFSPALAVYEKSRRTATIAVGTKIVQASKPARNASRTNTMISTALRFRAGRDQVDSPSMFTLKYGMTTRPITTSVGIRIPATNGGKKCSSS